MAVKVIDASALAAVLFGEPEAASVADRLTGELVAPALLSFELANVCLMKMRRHPADRDRLAASFKLLARMAIRTVDVDHAGIVDLGGQSGLTAYDAAYLWLARRLGAELVTLDRKLAAAVVAMPQ